MTPDTEPLAEFRMRPEEMGADVLEPFMPKLQEIDLDKDKRPIGVAKILAESLMDAGRFAHAIDLLERLWERLPAATLRADAVLRPDQDAARSRRAAARMAVTADLAEPDAVDWLARETCATAHQ